MVTHESITKLIDDYEKRIKKMHETGASFGVNPYEDNDTLATLEKVVVDLKHLRDHK
jgi:hypothetical protein